MFSRDPKHHRPTPRTAQQAFGPYSRYDTGIYARTKRDILCAAAGVVLLGALYGWLLCH